MGGNGELGYQWEPVGYEELAWRVDPDALEGVPKSRRRKITGTYRAAVPFELRDKGILIPAELQSRMEEVAFLLVRFDAQQEARGYDLPALLLRSESAASSQIENMTSSVRMETPSSSATNEPFTTGCFASRLGKRSKADPLRSCMHSAHSANTPSMSRATMFPTATASSSASTSCSTIASGLPAWN